MKKSKLSVIAILLPALFFMGASSMVYAGGGKKKKKSSPPPPPKVDVCVKNELPAGSKNDIRYNMDGGYIGGWWIFFQRKDRRNSTGFGPGVQKCEKFNRKVTVSVETHMVYNSGGARGDDLVIAPALVLVRGVRCSPNCQGTSHETFNYK